MKKPNLYFAAMICTTLVISLWSSVSMAALLQQYKGLVNISSTISDGRYSLNEIASIAQQAGIKIVIITDRDNMSWEYGAWPLRKVIKRIVRGNSVFQYGIKRYLNKIKQTQEDFKKIVIIPGVESAPFYFWSGSIFKGDFTINGWHKHLLAIGLQNYKDYARLPVLGNEPGLRKNFNLLKLWPLFIAVVLFIFVKQKIYKILGLLLCGLFLINNFPYYDYKFTQYQGDLGDLAYQNYIDYVKAKGGFTFWAHPEVKNHSRQGLVSIKTDEHVRQLIHTQGYTGFAIFYEGYQIMGRPGGIWDELLTQYCLGKRRDPIWAVGCSEFDTMDKLSASVKDLQTIFLLPKLNQEQVLQALGSGSMYVARGDQSSNFTLESFAVIDTKNNTAAFVGKTLRNASYPVIYFKGGFNDSVSRDLEIKLISNVKVIKTFKLTAPFEITFQTVRPKRKTYYRLDIYGAGLHFITNPIFVE